MVTMFVKSGKYTLRVLFLIFVVLVMNIGAFAQTITLTVGSSQPGIAQLTWTTTNPAIQGYYIVERQVSPSLMWVALKQLNNATRDYKDTISYPYCSTPINPSYNFSYRVHFVSVTGSEVLSAPMTADLSDQTPPPNVQNLFVALGTTASGKFNPIISWSRITNDSILTYSIQRYNGFKWPVVGTVQADASSYIDQTKPYFCDSSYRYVIRTTDMCGNPGAPDYTLFVQTIKLDIAPPGPCDSVAKLSWNSPHVMPGVIGGYVIYRTDGDSTRKFVVYDTIYNDNQNLEKGHKYIYSVKAFNLSGNDTSSSCQWSWVFNPAALDTVYITQVSVEANSYIRVRYHFSPPGLVKTIILERSNEGCENFYIVNSLTVDSGSISQDSFINDTTADVNKQSYCYLIVAIDSCGNEKPSINKAESIFLKCNSSQTENTLTWNRYQTWTQGVREYSVFRTLDGQPIMLIPYSPIDPATYSFADQHSNIDPNQIPLYWVVANENPGNPYYSNAASKSNTCLINKDPILFMPNAFTPDGINNKFRPKPSPLFVDPQSFTMTIFNRWGQQLFETTDITEGWDGKINGRFLTAGLYVYLLTYKSLEGKEYIKRGTVFLSR